MRRVLLVICVLAGGAGTAQAQGANPSLPGCESLGAQNFEIGLRIDSGDDIDIRVWDVGAGTLVYGPFTATQGQLVGNTGCNWVAQFDGYLPPDSLDYPGNAELDSERLHRIDLHSASISRSFYYEVEVGGAQGADIFSPRGTTGPQPDIILVASEDKPYLTIYPTALSGSPDVDSFFPGFGIPDWVLPYDLPTICTALGCDPEDDEDYPFFATTPYTTAAPLFPITLRSSGTEDWIVPAARSYDWSSADVAEIRFAEAGVEIKGDLDVTGMTLAGSDASGWSGIRFEPGSGGTLSDILIERVGGTVGDYAVRIDESSPVFENVFIQNAVLSSQVGGVFVEGPHDRYSANPGPIFRNLTVRDMTWNALTATTLAGVRLIESVIDSNDRTGVAAGYNSHVYLYPSSTSSFQGTLVTDNEASGAYTSNGAEVTLGLYGYPIHGGTYLDGFNTVAGNTGKGLFGAYSGTLSAGGATYGEQRNRVYSNGSFDAYATQSGTAVYARCDWWGGSAGPSNTATAGGAVLDASEWLEVDPYDDPDTPCVSGPASAAVEARGSAREGGLRDRLSAGRDRRLPPATALGELSAVVRDGGGGPEAAAALTAVGGLGGRSNVPADVARSAEVLLAQHAVTGPHGAVARQALVGLRHRRGDLAGALALAEAMAAAPASEAEAVAAHVARVSLYHDAGRAEEARAAYRALVALVPGSEEADIARSLLALPLGAGSADRLAAGPSWALASGAQENLEGAVGAVSPNPASGRATVALSLGSEGWVDVAVYDVLGREVGRASRTLSAGAHDVPVGIGGLAPGAYVVRVALDGSPVVSRRLTVSR